MSTDAGTEDHYGFRPGTVEYCREPIFSKESSLAAAQLPPDPSGPVREMFKAMKNSGQRFVEEARRAAKTGDPAPAWKTLTAMAEYCNACHAAYRLK
jgi:predicted CxxxxCH...CXXCH cytochrome family protein